MGLAYFSLEANLSILEAAPCLTIFPTSMASAISCSSAPFSRAFMTFTSRHGWQLAVMDAPTAINRMVRSSSFMVHYLLSNRIDEGQKGKDTVKLVQAALGTACIFFPKDNF
jgi:hypothetical protein